MSLPVIVLPEAEADSAEAKAWYESKRQGWSMPLRLRVEEAMERHGTVKCPNSMRMRGHLQGGSQARATLPRPGVTA